MLRLLALSLLSAATLVACNPYDPDLGSHPFKCGSNEPKCPEGYACTNDVCVTSEPQDVDAPPATFQCADDSAIEPNNEPAMAFVTPIPSMPSYKLIGLAVCPTGDRDHFKFDINTNGLNFEASLVGVANRSSLSLKVLNSSGAEIASGAPVGGSPQIVQIALPNRLAVGSYILQVQSPDATENNYDLTLKVCSTPLPCPTN